jgi:hypothetical protein
MTQKWMLMFFLRKWRERTPEKCNHKKQLNKASFQSCHAFVNFYFNFKEFYWTILNSTEIPIVPGLEDDIILGKPSFGNKSLT